MTCSCNDTGRVLADRDKRTVEAACARCTAARLSALEAGAKQARKLARRAHKAQCIEAARITKALIAIGLVLGVALDDKGGAA